jgi:hypothetical protein
MPVIPGCGDHLDCGWLQRGRDKRCLFVDRVLAGALKLELGGHVDLLAELPETLDCIAGVPVDDLAAAILWDHSHQPVFPETSARS